MVEHLPASCEVHGSIFISGNKKTNKGNSIMALLCQTVTLEREHSGGDKTFVKAVSLAGISKLQETPWIKT